MLLDLSLAGGDGLEVAQQVHERWPKLPILVLSMHDESLHADRCLRAGASGYIMKQEPQEMIHYRQPPRPRRRGLPQRSDVEQAAASASPLEKLADRVLQIFRMIGQGHCVRAIAEQLYLSPRRWTRTRSTSSRSSPCSSASTPPAIA